RIAHVGAPVNETADQVDHADTGDPGCRPESSGDEQRRQQRDHQLQSIHLHAIHALETLMAADRRCLHTMALACTAYLVDEEQVLHHDQHGDDFHVMHEGLLLGSESYPGGGAVWLGDWEGGFVCIERWSMRIKS